MKPIFWVCNNCNHRNTQGISDIKHIKENSFEFQCSDCNKTYGLWVTLHLVPEMLKELKDLNSK